MKNPYFSAIRSDSSVQMEELESWRFKMDPIYHADRLPDTEDPKYEAACEELERENIDQYESVATEISVTTLDDFETLSAVIEHKPKMYDASVEVTLPYGSDGTRKLKIVTQIEALEQFAYGILAAVEYQNWLSDRRCSK